MMERSHFMDFIPRFKIVKKNRPGDNWCYAGVCCETEEAAQKQVDILKKEYPGVYAWSVKPVEYTSQV